MTEAELLNAVKHAAALFGFLVYHPWLSVKSTRGWPDLALVGRPGTRQQGRLLLVELKSERGRLAPAQDEWLGALACVPGVVIRVWRPADWLSGEVERVLRGEGA